jgi:hypothetical protein
MLITHRAAIGAIFAAALAAACETSPFAPSSGPSAADAGGPGDRLSIKHHGKVALCHVTGSGDYKLLSIGAAAEAAHRAQR